MKDGVESCTPTHSHTYQGTHTYTHPGTLTHTNRDGLQTLQRLQRPWLPLQHARNEAGGRGSKGVASVLKLELELARAGGSYKLAMISPDAALRCWSEAGSTSRESVIMRERTELKLNRALSRALQRYDTTRHDARRGETRLSSLIS